MRFYDRFCIPIVLTNLRKHGNLYKINKYMLFTFTLSTLCFLASFVVESAFLTVFALFCLFPCELLHVSA